MLIKTKTGETIMLGTPDAYKNYLETEIKRLSALGDNITQEEYKRLEDLMYEYNQIVDAGKEEQQEKSAHTR